MCASGIKELKEHYNGSICTGIEVVEPCWWYREPGASVCKSHGVRIYARSAVLFVL
jgi:hypothetical protein